MGQGRWVWRWLESESSEAPHEELVCFPLPGCGTEMESLPGRVNCGCWEGTQLLTHRHTLSWLQGGFQHRLLVLADIGHEDEAASA